MFKKIIYVRKQKNIDKNSISTIIFSKFLSISIKAILTVLVILCMELILKKGVNLIKWDFFVRLRTLFNLDIEMFAQFLICGIGVAGVFLALYYSNISTMYSIEYSNAPQRVRSLFENAIKENKSLSDIIQYLILSVLILGLLILGTEISYVFVGVIIIKSVNIIISFIINGNKIYRYSDVYDVLYARLCKLIFLTQNATCDGYQSNDGEIQKIYNAEAVAIFEDMNIVNNYFMAKNSITNFSASQNFVVSNLIILKNYFRLKNRIPTYSLWFKKEIEYKKWFAADFMTKKMALNTGTQLYPNYNTNVNWFEESILFVNNKTLDFLLANGCYVEIMYYIYNLAEISECWIKFGNTNLLLDHIRELSLKIEKSVLTLENNTKVEIEDVIEALCYLYKKCCLDFMKYISNLNIDEVDKLYKTDFSETECLKFNNKIFSSSAGVNICKKLKNEISIENKLVTPLFKN